MIGLEQLNDMNNVACDYLECSDMATATAHFRQALAFFKKFLSEVPQEGINASVSGNRCIAQMPFEALSLQSIGHLAGVPLNDCASCGSCSKICNLLHVDAIRMVPGYEFSRDCVENLKVQTAIVVFNMALTTHMQGLTQGSHRQLAQAQALYHQTYRLIHNMANCTYQGEATGNAAFDVLVLALYNNMALMHLEFSDYTESAAIFRQLVRYAMSMPRTFPLPTPLAPEGNGTHTNEGIFEQINNFLLNATILGMSPPVAAGAA